MPMMLIFHARSLIIVAHPVPWIQDKMYAAAFSLNSAKACRGLLNPRFVKPQSEMVFQAA